MSRIEVIIVFFQTTDKQSKEACFRDFRERRISVSSHFEKREKERNLDRAEIMNFLNHGLDGIIAIEDVSDKEEEMAGLGHKFIFLYRKNAKHDMHLVVSWRSDGSYNIVSAREQNIKKRDAYFSKV